MLPTDKPLLAYSTAHKVCSIRALGAKAVWRQVVRFRFGSLNLGVKASGYWMNCQVQDLLACSRGNLHLPRPPTEVGLPGQGLVCRIVTQGNDKLKCPKQLYIMHSAVLRTVVPVSHSKCSYSIANAVKTSERETMRTRVGTINQNSQGYI